MSREQLLCNIQKKYSYNDIGTYIPTPIDEQPNQGLPFNIGLKECKNTTIL